MPHATSSIAEMVCEIQEPGEGPNRRAIGMRATPTAATSTTLCPVSVRGSRESRMPTTIDTRIETTSNPRATTPAPGTRRGMPKSERMRTNTHVPAAIAKMGAAIIADGLGPKMTDANDATNPATTASAIRPVQRARAQDVLEGRAACCCTAGLLALLGNCFEHLLKLTTSGSPAPYASPD